MRPIASASSTRADLTCMYSACRREPSLPRSLQSVSALSAVPEMVRARERGDDLGRLRDAPSQRREAFELADEDVSVPLDTLVAAADEHDRLAADDPAVALVDVLRNDQVHLAVLVLEQHEDDPLGRRRALPRNRHAGERDVRAVPRLVELRAREGSRR